MKSSRVSDDEFFIVNQIVETLNRSIDVHSVLNDTLRRLVQVMGVQTAWIALKKPAGSPPSAETHYLAAHVNLPPALSPHDPKNWKGICDCQLLASQGHLPNAVNEVICSRLRDATADHQGLDMHASVPLRSGDRILGILNVAGKEWNAFSPQALSILSNIGNHLGVALERASLYDMLKEKHISEQAAFLKMSNRLLGSIGLDDLAEVVVDEVVQITGANGCAIFLPMDGTEKYSLRAACGWWADRSRSLEMALAAPTSDYVLGSISQEGLLPEDGEGARLLSAIEQHLVSENFRSYIMIRLGSSECTSGILLLNSRSEADPLKEDIGLLRLIANQLSIAIEQVHMREDGLVKLQLERELEAGREIQSSLLPARPPSIPGWEFALRYRPAKTMGGDFYDFINFPAKPERLGVVIADVIGKGVPASLLMAVSQSVIRASALSSRNPARALARANTILRKYTRAEFFLSVFYLILYPQNGHIVYSNGGHVQPLWLHASSGECEPLNAKGTTLGVFKHLNLVDHEDEVEKGDCLIFFTDGLTEATDPQKRLFGHRGIREIVEANRDARPKEVLDRVTNSLAEFARENPEEDDQTILVLKRL